MDIKNIKELRSIEKTEFENVEGVIRKTIKNVSPMTYDFYFKFAFAAYMNKKYECESESDLLKVIRKEFSEEVEMFMKDAMDDIENNYSLVKEVEMKVSEEELLAYVIFSIGEIERLGRKFPSPKWLTTLSMSLLQIKKNDNVADFGCGIGTFLVDAFLQNNEANYYGIDIDTASKEISFIKNKLIGSQAVIEQGDMFNLCNTKKFDKIFSNYTLGLKLRDMYDVDNYIEELKKVFPDIAKISSPDWIFNSLLAGCLTEDGKAIGLMVNGGTWNIIDRPIREYFVRKGLIESVIALPDHIVASTDVGMTLVVFSHNNSSIRMVDARSLYKKEGSKNVLLQSHIDCIIKSLSENTEISTTVEIDKIADNDFVISPSRYLEKSVTFDNGVEFGSLIKRITRGAPLMSRELDNLISEEPTSQQYLMLANIQDGIIDDELQYLKEIDDKLQKYCVNNNSLLLSKNGPTFKVAVANVEDQKRILVSGNFYIIELDEEKVNPYFLNAFFESEIGTVLLKQISVGEVISNISVESLKKVLVPLPSMEEQKNIADNYLAKMDEIKILRIKLRKAINDIKNIYGEV